jgi:Flp pilus assembly protein TadD
MIRFLLNLFSRKPKAEFGSIIEELWKPSFKSENKCRFLLEKTGTYDVSIEEQSLKLLLKHSDLFAWAENPVYRYRDFILESRLVPGASNGKSSGGFVLRRAGDLNYYYFLVSPEGRFRFDVVFNGTPRILIGWTECAPAFEGFDLRIVARGSYFCFFLNQQWIGEVDDDTIDAGGISPAAQNYKEQDTASFQFSDLAIESRSFEVEAQYYRWRHYIPVDPAGRITLGRSHASAGQFSSALIQLTRAKADKPLDPEDLILLGECQRRAGLYDNAEQTVDSILESDPDNLNALAEKANLLYLQNRLVDLREFLVSRLNQFSGNAIIWNLYGNACYALGAQDEAAPAYEKAAGIDPTIPIYHLNAARSWEHLGEKEKSLARYVDAARLLFRQEEYDELSGLLPKIEELDKNNPEVLAVKGKIAFGNGNFETAEEIFAVLLSKSKTDSGIHYLYGMLLSRRGEREAASAYFGKAAEMEPDYYLYWFRLAENELLLGKDAGPAIRTALELAPDDIWVLNLAGLHRLELSDNAGAYKVLEKARELVGEEDIAAGSEYEDIIINLSEASHRTGRIDEAISLLSPFRSSPALLNQLGNLLSKEEKFEEASEVYERSLRLSPGNRDIMINCAAACIEADRILHAEEILTQLLQEKADARVSNLMGHAAQLKGELLRAEAAYIQALELEPDNQEIALNLATVQVQRRQFIEARSTLKKYLRDSNHPRVIALNESVVEATEIVIQCKLCDRRWSADRRMVEQPRLKLSGELPDESPAGRCPECDEVYCIGCAKASLKDGRFFCPDCGVALKLSDNHLRCIVTRYVP